MYLPGFIFHKPKTLKEAISLLENSPDAALMAGGTDLLVEMKKGLRSHQDVVSLSRVDDLKFIDEDDKNLYIGGGVTHNTLISSQVIRRVFPALSEAAMKIGSDQVRNAGTIGGNLCTAASCCDTAPILLSADASLEILDSHSARTVPLRDFFIFNKRTILRKAEIVCRVIVPKPLPGTGFHYEKYGLREAGSISVVSVAAMIRIKDGLCVDACIVIGAVAPTPKISEKATAIIRGRKLEAFEEGSDLLDQAGQAAVEDSIPIDDIRGGAQYRRDILKVLTQRAILKALAGLSS